MSKQGLEKRLYVTNLKITKTIKDSKSSFKEKLVTTVIMIGLAIFGPEYRVKGTKKTIKETFNLQYYEAMVLCAAIVFIFFLFVSAALLYQNYIKLKRLHKEKERVENLIAKYY